MPNSEGLLYDILTRCGDISNNVLDMMAMMKEYLLPLLGVLIFVVFLSTCIKSL